MVTRPVIFVSAVSKELKSARQLVANTLQFLGYTPVWEDIFGSDQGDLRELLRKKIDVSNGVVQVVGQCYGTELPVIDAHFGRASYTQYEALYARKQGRKVWILLLDDTFAADPHEPESDELRALQVAYRGRIRADLLLYHPLDNKAALEANVLKLRDELVHLRRRGQQWAALILALLVLTALGVWLARNDTGKVRVQTLQIAAGQQQSAKRETDLAAKLGQVQEALSRIQQNTDPKRDPVGEWPQERLETELARQMQIKVKDVSSILAAGKTSLDALLQGQALLASGKAREAGKKFDIIIQREQDAMTRLRQAYEGKAQIAFNAVKYEEALEFREKAAALLDKSADPGAWADAEQMVAFIDFHLGRYEQAEPLQKEVVRLREERHGPDDPALATALNNLAESYHRAFRAERMGRDIRRGRGRFQRDAHRDAEGLRGAGEERRGSEAAGT